MFQKIEIKKYMFKGCLVWPKCKIYPIPIEVRAEVLQAFIELEDNSIKNVVNKSGYSRYIVNRIIDDRYKIRI